MLYILMYQMYVSFCPKHLKLKCFQSMEQKQPYCNQSRQPTHLTSILHNCGSDFALFGQIGTEPSPHPSPPPPPPILLLSPQAHCHTAMPNSSLLSNVAVSVLKCKACAVCSTLAYVAVLNRLTQNKANTLKANTSVRSSPKAGQCHPFPDCPLRMTSVTCFQGYSPCGGEMAAED